MSISLGEEHSRQKEIASAEALGAYLMSWGKQQRDPSGWNGVREGAKQGSSEAGGRAAVRVGPVGLYEDFGFSSGEMGHPCKSVMI